MERRLRYGDQACTARHEGPNRVSVHPAQGEAAQVEMHEEIGGSFQVQAAEGRITGEAVRTGNLVWVRWRGRTYRIELDQPRSARKRGGAGGGDLTAPMPGQVIKLLVEEGAEVKAGDTLLVVEAMKMQLEIKAPAAGTVTGLPHGEGDNVGAGELLVHLEASE